MLWDVLACHGMFWDVLKCREMSWDGLGCPGMSWDVLGYTGMFWNVLDVLGCSGVSPGVGCPSLQGTNCQYLIFFTHGGIFIL